MPDDPSRRADRLRRVLIVEDDADCRELLGQILAHPRVSLAFAADGVEALRMAHEVEPEVILLDMRLPHLDGPEVLAGLARERRSAARVILMSGNMKLDARQHGAALGAYACLKKPFDLRELERLFLQALELTPSAAGVPVAAPPSPDRIRRLLIVDDSVDDAEVLEALVAHPRVAIERATNGLTGLMRAREARPDALLLDVLMPGMNGFEVFQTLRRDRAFPRTILMSATADAEVFTSAIELGAYACYRKPFEDAAEFRETVWRALEVEPAASAVALDQV